MIRWLRGAPAYGSLRVWPMGPLRVSWSQRGYGWWVQLGWPGPAFFMGRLAVSMRYRGW